MQTLLTLEDTTQPLPPPVSFANLGDRFGKTLRPLVIAYGLGVDSTAMLIELARRYQAGEKAARPDLILFADTGGEKPETYAYEPVMQAFLLRVGFPAFHTVKYRPRHEKYTTLEGNCLVNTTLPSLAFGRKGCSLKWKREPQDRYVRGWRPARDAWAAGLSCIKCIGYDAGAADSRRSNIADDREYHYWYPLRELGWTRELCEDEIRREGLPVPPKSACFFCPATKPAELVQLATAHPDLCRRIEAIEAGAAPKLVTVQGLWRTATKTRPGSMTEFLKDLPQ